jgi:hypothetical protein
VRPDGEERGRNGLDWAGFGSAIPAAFQVLRTVLSAGHTQHAMQVRNVNPCFECPYDRRANSIAADHPLHRALIDWYALCMVGAPPQNRLGTI